MGRTLDVRAVVLTHGEYIGYAERIAASAGCRCRCW